MAWMYIMYCHVILKQRWVICVFDEILWKTHLCTSVIYLQNSCHCNVLERLQVQWWLSVSPCFSGLADTFKVSRVLNNVWPINFNFSQFENTQSKVCSRVNWKVNRCTSNKNISWWSHEHKLVLRISWHWITGSSMQIKWRTAWLKVYSKDLF